MGDHVCLLYKSIDLYSVSLKTVINAEELSFLRCKYMSIGLCGK